MQYIVSNCTILIIKQIKNSHWILTGDVYFCNSINESRKHLEYYVFHFASDIYHFCYPAWKMSWCYLYTPHFLTSQIFLNYLTGRKVISIFPLRITSTIIHNFSILNPLYATQALKTHTITREKNVHCVKLYLLFMVMLYY